MAGSRRTWREWDKSLAVDTAPSKVVTGHIELSIVLPARDEAAGLSKLLPILRERFPRSEIIVVDDGSSDQTIEICDTYGVSVVRHAKPRGNGSAIKSGARVARGEWLMFLDADGQHNPEDIQRMLDARDSGDSMIVGARSFSSQAGIHRALANRFYNWLASWIVDQPVEDLTSGFRVVEASKFRKFLHLLPNGFSYPTTITMSFFRAGYGVRYVPITARRREGRSHIRLTRDGMRFLLIIFRVGTLYSPLKVFLPISLAFFVTGLSYYLYTFVTTHRFTNMSALLFITSVLVFLIGLVSEQITALNFRDTER